MPRLFLYLRSTSQVRYSTVDTTYRSKKRNWLGLELMQVRAKLTILSELSLQKIYAYCVSASFLKTCCFGETECWWTDGRVEVWRLCEYLERLRRTMRNVEKANFRESNFQSLEHERKNINHYTATSCRPIFLYGLFKIAETFQSATLYGLLTYCCYFVDAFLLYECIIFKQLLYFNWKWDTGRTSPYNAPILLVCVYIYNMSAISFCCHCQKKKREE